MYVCYHPEHSFLKVITILLLCFLLTNGCSNNGNGEYISASGTIEAVQVKVSAEVGGRIERLLIDEGTLVDRGDTLAEIDHSALDIRLRGAQAGVDAAEARLQLLLNGARSEDIEQAESALIQAQANLKLAQEDLKRTRQLFDTGSATRKQIDDLETRYTIAESQYNSAQQALMKIQQFARPEEIRAGKAKLEGAKSTRDLLLKNISDCWITAPVSGFITTKSCEAGEKIRPGMTAAVITNLEKVDLTIYVTETELGWVNLGQTVEVSIDSHPDTAFVGEVVYISPQAEFTPKNIQTREERVKLVFGIKVQIDNPGHILKPGMPADAKILISNPNPDEAESATAYFANE